MFSVDDVVNDIREGLLPPVTWITPRFELSEHPEYNFCHGENWTTKVIDAIMRSPMWESTAIFLTWDDYGGFYDHVPPPQVDDFGFGIRVLMIVLSPYSQGVERRARRVLERAPVHRGQLGPHPAHQARQAGHADALGVRFRAGAAGAPTGLRSATTAWARSGLRTTR